MKEATKICSRCEGEYPATDIYFAVKSSNKSGLAPKCRPCAREDWAERRKADPEYHRRWREKNPNYYKGERWRGYRLDWKLAHPDYYREYNSRPKQKIRSSVARGMRYSLGDGKNGRSWESLVGYTLDDLMAHLEPQFTEGMSWENYGEWHIDHIKPISHFNFGSTSDPEFHQCWSLWNLQPLWASDNLSKHNHCPQPPLPFLHREVT